MIDRAAKFAEQAHKGAHRKGTRIPYIVHPLETALIASMLTNDEEILAAALLHDNRCPSASGSCGAFCFLLTLLPVKQTDHAGCQYLPPGK